MFSESVEPFYCKATFTCLCVCHLKGVVMRTHGLSLALVAKGGEVIHTSVASILLCQMISFRHCVCDVTFFC